MPTKNRRVATYLPQELDASFEAFKVARDIEGDSQALITVLSEFLGVSQQVAHSANFAEYATKKELETLSVKVAHLVEQIQDIDGFVERAVKRTVGELQGELQGELPSRETENTPGQLGLLDDSEPLSEEDNTFDKGWISSKEAWEILQPPNCSYDAFRKYSPEKLNQRFGLQTDLGRKARGKNNPKWIKMPNTVDPQGELLGELVGELPNS